MSKPSARAKKDGLYQPFGEDLGDDLGHQGEPSEITKEDSQMDLVKPTKVEVMEHTPLDDLLDDTTNIMALEFKRLKIKAGSEKGLTTQETMQFSRYADALAKLAKTAALLQEKFLGSVAELSDDELEEMEKEDEE